MMHKTADFLPICKILTGLSTETHFENIFRWLVTMIVNRSKNHERFLHVRQIILIFSLAQILGKFASSTGISKNPEWTVWQPAKFDRELEQEKPRLRDAQRESSRAGPVNNMYKTFLLFVWFTHRDILNFDR